MDIQSIWLIVLAVSSPICGLLGFAIQLRNVRQLRLQNLKLNLEIEALNRNKEQSENQSIKVGLEIDDLRKRQRSSERKILMATNDEVVKYGRGRSDSLLYRLGDLGEKHKKRFDIEWEIVGVFVVVLVLSFYFIFDLYRMIKWLYLLF